MTICMYKLFSSSGNKEQYPQAEEFYKVFEEGFRGLDNLPLTKQAEAASNS